MTAEVRLQGMSCQDFPLIIAAVIVYKNQSIKKKQLEVRKKVIK